MMTANESQLRALRIAVINYAAKQSGYSFDPRTLTIEDVAAIGEVMVNDDDTLDLYAVIMLATLRAGDVPEAS
jgi:hypothetical protein